MALPGTSALGGDRRIESEISLGYVARPRLKRNKAKAPLVFATHGEVLGSFLSTTQKSIRRQEARAHPLRNSVCQTLS